MRSDWQDLNGKALDRRQDPPNVPLSRCMPDRCVRSEQRTHDLARGRVNLLASSLLAQMLSFNFEEAGFNCGGAAEVHRPLPPVERDLSAR